MEYPQNAIATRNHSEKTGRNNPMLTVIKSIALLFLFFCGGNVVWAEGAIDKSPYDDITDPTPDNLPTYSGTCEDLYPVTDFNNLLTQIYRHLDDDCLYLMSTDKLSEKLGIAVIAYEDDQTGKIIDILKEREKLLTKAFSGFRSSVFLHKSLYGKIHKKDHISLNEQRKIYQLPLRERKALYNDKYNARGFTYDIRISHNYIKHLDYPLEKTLPSQLPLPAGKNHTLKSIDDVCYIVPDNPDSFIYHYLGKAGKIHKKLHNNYYYWWKGYTSSAIRFRSCENGGAIEFTFYKTIFGK